METAVKFETVPELKIDLGCGKRKQEGHVGLDRIAFDGVDHVLNIGIDRWPFEDGTVDAAYTCHFVEHLTSVERIHFANELFRVLKVGGKCTLIVPHWGTSRAYGDPTHQWPPVGEFWFYYLDRKWRAENAPHTMVEHWDYGFTCDFETTWGYGLSPTITSRSQDFQQFAINYYREAIFDIHATLTKKG
jgi:SAM-dependent methyltransferase